MAMTSPTINLRDLSEKIEAFGLFTEREQWFKVHELETFIHQVLGPVPSSSAISPEVKRIYEMRRGLGRLSRADNKRILIPDLLANEAISKAPDALPQIHRVDDINFSGTTPAYHNGESVDKVMERLGFTATPCPEICFGYITSQIARDFGISQYPFTEKQEEDVKATITPLSSQLHFPFLTWRARAAIEGGGFMGAEIAGARDGCAVVASNYRFLRWAGYTNPPQWTTCHFSGAHDGKNVKLYLHWRWEQANGHTTYEMDTITEAPLRNPYQLQLFRQAVRNLFDWALNERLQVFRDIALSMEVRRSLRGLQPPPPIPTPPPLPRFSRHTCSSAPPTPSRSTLSTASTAPNTYPGPLPTAPQRPPSQPFAVQQPASLPPISKPLGPPPSPQQPINQPQISQNLIATHPPSPSQHIGPQSSAPTPQSSLPTTPHGSSPPLTSTLISPPFSDGSTSTQSSASEGARGRKRVRTSGPD